MKITLPNRKNIPETTLWVDIMTLGNNPLGQDRDVMLLVPGGPGGNHSVYDEIKEELFKYTDLILFDPRGCGYSDASDVQYCTLDHYRDDIEAIRKYFCLEKIILFGGSYGAMAALGYAVKYQKRIEKLILCGGSPSFKFIEIAKENLRARGTKIQIKQGEKLFSGKFANVEEFSTFYKILASLYMYNTQDSLPTTKSNIPYNIEITNLGFTDFLKTFDFELYLTNIMCKTLIISGKNDWINDPSLAELMAHKIPNSTLVLLERCGHFIWRDQREKFLETLENFLAKP